MAILATKNPHLYTVSDGDKNYVTRSKISVREQKEMFRRAETFEKTNICVVDGDIDRSRIKWAEKKKK